MALVAGYARRISGEADERRDRWPSTASAGSPTPTPCCSSSTRSPRRCRPRSTSTRCSTPPWSSCASCSTPTPSRSSCSTTPTGAGTPLRRDGGRPPSTIAQERPPAARWPAPSPCAASVSEHEPRWPAAGPGSTPARRSGLYAVLTGPRVDRSGWSRIEHGDAAPLHRPRPRAAQRASSSRRPSPSTTPAGSAGCARVGADEERTRIARDLHDRIGQSLAYLAFELDRIVKNGASGRRHRPRPLDNLRTDVRGVIGEVRDTLYDLRTDVTEAAGPGQHARGVPRPGAGAQRPRVASSGRRRPAACRSSRSGSCGASPRRRSPTSSATPRPPTSTVTWRCDGTRRRLEVADDGVGFPVGEAGRLDSYGLARHARAGRQHRRHPRRRLRARAAAPGYAAPSTPAERAGTDRWRTAA